MNEWLYGDEGYYQKFKAIGKGGDFYTAVSASPFFGASIANEIFRLIKSSQIPRDTLLLEVGAHQGYLLCDMIQWLYTVDRSLIHEMRFGIVERHKELQSIQRDYIKSRFGDDIEVEFFDDLSHVGVEHATIVANEIFDAFACELYKDEKIAIVDNHQISWIDAPTEILDFAKKHRLKTGEVAVGYDKFANRMAQAAKNVEFITFDYGERYVRNDFSIRVYKKHETFPLFDEELVLQSVYKKADITFDVNFNHVIDEFENSGFELVDYETQARALVRFGVIDLLEQFAKSTTYAKYMREVDGVKTLISPTVMGDRFKMLHMRK